MWASKHIGAAPLSIAAVIWVSCSAWAAPAQRAVAESTEARVVAHFRAAQEATRAGHIDQAVDEYKKVLRLDPSLVEARANLGLAYHMLGQYDLAVAELAKASEKQPQLLAANLFLGIGYLKLGSCDKAIMPLEQALAADHSNREARRALAACYLAKDDYRQATNQFRALFALESNQEEAWFRLGHDTLDLARRLTGRVSQRYGASAWAERLAGDVLAERGLWNDAARAYRRALATQPTEPGLYAKLGYAQLRQGRVEDAEAEFRRELGLDPGNEEALLGLAEVELAMTRPRAALESVTRISFPAFLAPETDFPLTPLKPQLARQMATDLEKLPQQMAGHFLLSALYKAAGDVERAGRERAAFQEQLEAWQSTQATTRGAERTRDACRARRYRACADFLGLEKLRTFKDNLLLGKSLLALDQDQPAADAFAAALAQEKNSPEAMYWLVRTSMRFADHCFEQLEKLFPDSWRAHQLRAEAYQVRQAEAQAIEEYRLAARLSPEAGELHEALGELYLSKNLLAEASPELQKAVQLNPMSARGLYLLGRLLVAEHQPEKAVPYLEKALRYEPGLLDARATLGRAYLRLGRADLAVPELEKCSTLDHYGDLHYLLYQAYHSLGKSALAQKALARSQELRRTSAAGDQAKLGKPDRDQ